MESASVTRAGLVAVARYSDAERLFSEVLMRRAD